MDCLSVPTTRTELRQWYMLYASSAKELMVPISMREEAVNGTIYYVDAVEEALCFGWIDSVHRRRGEVVYARFSPRRRGSHWTELNRARCRRLIRLGLMTPAGLAVMPDEQRELPTLPWIQEAVRSKQEVYEQLMSFPPLYLRIRLYNIYFTDVVLRDHTRALAQMDRLLTTAARGQLYGDWNDHGRLSDDE